jgi:hypothetical protein
MNNKFYLIPLFAILTFAAVFAGVYIVNYITFTSNVKENFVYQYAVLGDAGNYEGGTCADATTWFTSDSVTIPTGDIYPGESRRVCVKITNLGQADVPYTVTSTITNDNEAGDCLAAYGYHEITGIATKLTDTVDGVTLTIPYDAKVVQGCNIRINAGRGTLPTF